MNDTIPLQLLSLEWGIEADTLAAQLGDKLITDALRIRHVAVVDAIAMLEQRDREAAVRRAADEKRNAEQAQQSARLHARIDAIQRRSATVRATDPTLTAAAVMMGADKAAELDTKGSILDEMLAAGRAGDVGVMHRITPSPEKG
jgi:hypothetical protein